jgi:hypothetical protein
MIAFGPDLEADMAIENLAALDAVMEKSRMWEECMCLGQGCVSKK